MKCKVRLEESSDRGEAKHESRGPEPPPLALRPVPAPGSGEGPPGGLSACASTPELG